MTRARRAGVYAGAALLLIAGLAGAQPAAPAAVLVAEYDGIIHPVAAEFLDDALARARRDNAAALVLVLRTPGGLLESTRTMVSSMIASPVPVIVFVSPSGARAASAGFILTIAADVAAMAPGTHIGAAHPADVSGRTDGTAGDKAAADTAAFARTLAAARGRNVSLAEAAVLESRAFTEQEARDAEPPLIDLVADDLPHLLRQLEGREVRRFDGRAGPMRTAGAAIEHMQMSRRQQVLSAIAHPQIAYMLLSLGMLGLVVELWNPGALVPGVLGGISLMLAFFAFQILPVDVAGLLLVLLGISLLIMEATVPSVGVLGVGGAIALAAGSVMITDELPGVHVSYATIAAVTGSVAVIVVGLGRLAMRAQRQRPFTGAAALAGATGSALTALSPAAAGQVSIRGEIWRATSRHDVPRGATVRVVGVQGLTLDVEPAEAPPSQGG